LKFDRSLRPSRSFVDTAVPTRLLSVTEALVGNKLRLAGRMLSYDSLTSLVLLQDQDVAVLVDVSLCVDKTSAWVREKKCVVMVVGHLEESPTPLPIPVLPAYAPAPVIDPHIVLRALVVTSGADLDMRLWNGAIEERECAGVTG